MSYKNDALTVLLNSKSLIFHIFLFPFSPTSVEKQNTTHQFALSKVSNEK